MPLWVNTITIERIRLLNQNRCCYESFYYGQRSTVYRLSHLRSCLCDGAQRGAARAERAPFSSPHYGPYLRLAKSPVTCHHCENAPCAQSCPNGAITQHSDSVQVNQQKCIGCKACVVACPFGTMDMLIAPLENDSVKASAHKCDLCSERPQGPACVENCPAEVLTLATPAVLDKLVKQRRQRSARLTRCRGTARRFSQSLRKPNGNRCKTPRRAVSRKSSAPTRAQVILTRSTCRFARNRRSAKHPGA